MKVNKVHQSHIVTKDIPMFHPTLAGALALACVSLLPLPAKAEWKNVAELWRGYEITPSEKREIEGARMPGAFMSCCSLADGIPIEWDIKDGHYWANWDGAWRQIPDEKVLKNLKVGFSILWVTKANKMLQHKDGTYENLGYRDVRCFWPGAGG